MGRSSIPPALVELSNPTTPEAQVAALRNLKNEIVGHDQRKELAVRHGVVKPLAGILRAEARKGGKRRRNSVMNGSGSAGREGDRPLEWTSEDELRFQATLVVGSLANGGPAFLTPLLAGNTLSPLLEALSPAVTPPKLIIATLRTINQIADATAQEKPTDLSVGPSITSVVCERLYARPVVESFAEILAQPSRASTAHQQVSLTTKLIAKTCREEGQRKVLLEAGILDLLATKLAAIASVDAQSLREVSNSPSHDELPVMYLAEILEAISAIVRDSHYNTARFLYAQPIHQLFGLSKDGTTCGFEGYAGSSQTPWDRLTPRLQTMQNKTDAFTRQYPPLGSPPPGATGSGYRPSSLDTVQPNSRTVITDESENPLFIWLMYVARRGEGKTRLSACWLLALLKKFGEKWSLNDPAKVTRERYFSYLVIPLVAKMVEEANPASEQARKASLNPQAIEESRFVLERSPLVLAELVTGNKTLQKAADDAKVLTTLVKILKKSFEPVAASVKPLWSPKSNSQETWDPMVDQVSSSLGEPGLGAEVLHAFRYRESALLALAAMADSQDSLRKLIIELGAAPHIIDSLVPFTEGTVGSSASHKNAASTAAKGGNPVPVLIAACKVTRSLSRSISVLRTSLIDHGIAQPSFDLLTHPDVKVQIAATEVITNLVLEVSPMRTEIIEAGALKTLCEHCRSANFDLRYGSLWALKHLCLGLPSATKIQCLDELGVGWLVQTLNGEPVKSAVSTPLGMGTPNAAGEQVDILNAVDDPHMDVDQDTSSEEDEDTMTDSIPSMRQQYQPGSRYTSATNIRDRLQQIKNDEQDLRLNNERDDLRIQEQALDYIRNFINEDKSQGDMIDHLLKTFGHSRFFELLDAKIRPKGSSVAQSSTPSYWTNNPSQRTPNYRADHSSIGSAASPNWAAYPPTELIIGTMYILVHLANGRPQHRSLLISQTNLMTHVLPLLSHARRDVRLPCAWFINNLTWQEDDADKPASRERAVSLRALGYEEGLKILKGDIDQDIRERAKTAIDQMANLLGENTGRGGSAFMGSGGFGGGDGGSGAGSGGGGLSGVVGSGRMGSGLGSLTGHRNWGRDTGA